MHASTQALHWRSLIVLHHPGHATCMHLVVFSRAPHTPVTDQQRARASCLTMAGWTCSMQGFAKPHASSAGARARLQARRSMACRCPLEARARMQHSSSTAPLQTQCMRQRQSFMSKAPRKGRKLCCAVGANRTLGAQGGPYSDKLRLVWLQNAVASTCIAACMRHTNPKRACAR